MPEVVARQLLDTGGWMRLEEHGEEFHTDAWIAAAPDSTTDTEVMR